MKTRMKLHILDMDKLLFIGILHSFLYNNYWARLEEKESTGNASRDGGGLRLPPYGTTPTIQRTNIILEDRTATRDELIREVGMATLFDRFKEPINQTLNPENFQ